MVGRGRPKKNISNTGTGGAIKNTQNNISDDGHSDEIQSTLKMLLTEVRDIRQSQRDIRHSQEFMSDTQDDMLSEVRQISKEHQAMKGELRSVSVRQNKMSSELDNLKARINKLEQAQLVNGIVVRGIAENGDAVATIVQLAEALEIDFNGDAEIIKAQWMQTKSNGESIAFIKAELTNETMKNEIIKQAKRMRVSTTMLGLEGDERPVFVDEITTQQTRSLYAEARKLRDYGVKYVWVSKGDVLIREKDGAKVQRIDSLHTIEQIKKTRACTSDNSNVTTSNPRHESQVQVHVSAQPVNRLGRKRHQSIDSFESDESMGAQPAKRANSNRENNNPNIRRAKPKADDRLQRVARTNCYVLSPARTLARGGHGNRPSQQRERDTMSNAH